MVFALADLICFARSASTSFHYHNKKHLLGVLINWLFARLSVGVDFLSVLHETRFQRSRQRQFQHESNSPFQNPLGIGTECQSIRLMAASVRNNEKSVKEDWTCCKSIDKSIALGLRLRLKCKRPAFINKCFHCDDKTQIVEPRLTPLSYVRLQ